MVASHHIQVEIDHVQFLIKEAIMLGHSTERIHELRHRRRELTAERIMAERKEKEGAAVAMMNFMRDTHVPVATEENVTLLTNTFPVVPSYGRNLYL